MTNQRKLINFGRRLYERYPSLYPFLFFFKKVFFSKPKFDGWGMRTERELPWIDEFDGKIFRETSVQIKKQFEFNKKITGIDSKNIDTLLWRHWVVTTAIRYTIKFSQTNEYNFIECGVGEGITAYFSLKEISQNQKITKFSMHLYDAWDTIKQEQLLESEKELFHSYKALNIEQTKKNLSEFSNYTVYHQGYIPESFDILPKPPNSICYLHIDLNAVKPTLACLEFFFPRLVKGGVILFDDYGSITYNDTKLGVDKFFFDKAGILIKMPTGQAYYIHR